MTGWALGAAWGAFLLAGALLSVRGRRPLYRFRSFFWGASGSGVPAGLLTGDWTMAVLAAAALAVLAWDKRGGRGKRTAKALGAKGRAALAAVVERMREAGAPVPQGVRG